MKIKSFAVLVCLLIQTIPLWAANNLTKLYIPKRQQLMNLSQTGDMEVLQFILDEGISGDLKTVRLKLNDDYKTIKIGSLMAVGETGLWLYAQEDELITYVPYKLINNFQHSYSKYGFIATGAILGGLGTAVAFQDIGGFPIGAILFGGASALILPVYQSIRAGFSSYSYSFSNSKSYLNFYKQKRELQEVYGQYIDIQSYPSDESYARSAPEVVQNQVVKSENPSKKDTVAKNVISNNDLVNHPNTSIDSKPAKIPFVNDQGKLNIDWIIRGYSGSSFNEKELLKKIPYIRSNYYESSQLQSLNKSELQFLCMYLITPNGYHFKGMDISFTANQLKVLQNLESFSNQELKKGDAISTQLFSLSDMQNLKTIYELLNQ